MQSMDLSYLQSIMEPEDFERLDKSNELKLFEELFYSTNKVQKTEINSFLVKYIKANPDILYQIFEPYDEEHSFTMPCCDMIKIMCELGANVNYIGNRGILSHSWFNGSLCCAKVLLEYDIYTCSNTSSFKSIIEKEFAIMVKNVRLLNIPA